MTATSPAMSPAAPDRLTLAAFLAVVVFGGVNAIAVKLSVEERSLHSGVPAYG